MLPTQSWVSAPNTPTKNLDKPGFSHYDTDAYTMFLLQSDTTNGSTTFTDLSDSPHTITNNGADHVTAQQKIGATSIYFDGDDYLTWPDTDRLSFGREAFTLEYWFKDTSGGDVNQRVIGQGGGTGTGAEAAPQWFIRPGDFSTSHQIYANFEGTNIGIGETWNTINTEDGNWHHICLTKGDNEDSTAVLQIAVDGIFDHGFGVVNAAGGKTIAQDADWRNLEGVAAGPLWHLGGPNFMTERWAGWLDEIRISVGIQRWTANFTVY